MERSNFIDIQKQVQILDDLFEKHVSNVKEAVNVYNQLSTATANIAPSSVISASKQISNSVATTNKVVQQQNKLLKQNVQAIFDQAKTYQSLAKQKEQALRQAEKERQQAEKLNNAYNRISALMRQATAEYNNLAARKNFGIALTEKENARYLQLQARIERFNGVLKKTDADIGKFNRNVGNYGTQWDGLRFQTTQLIRELPSMAYGVNMFFGAISNNLPYFLDEVKKAREEQRLAIEQGKQAPGVLSRITGALFNWQTVLVLGITYLTLHAKEVVNWIKELWGANTALEELTKNQKAFSEAKLLGVKNAQSEILEYRKYIATVKDATLSDEERMIALEALRSKYPYYFKNLTDAQILAGETAEAENKLRVALEKRKELEEKSEINVKNRQALVDINKQIIEQEKEVSRLESIRSQLTNADPQVQAKAAKDVANAERELLKLQQVRTELAFNIHANETDIVKLKKETIGLEFAITKERQGQKQSNYDYIDSLASEYELMKLIYEQAIKNNRDIYEDETKTFDQRAKALLKMYQDEKELNDLNKKEQIRLAEIQYKEEMALLEKAEISKSEKLKQEKEIYQKHYYELNIIEQKWFEEKMRIQKEEAQGYDVIIRKLWEYNTLLNGISKGQLDDRGKELDKLSKVNFGKATKSLEQFNENIQQLEKAEKLGKLYAELAKNEDDMQRLVKMGVTMESDAYQKLKAERIKLERQIQEEQAKTFKKSIEQVAKLEQAYKRLFGGFTNDTMSSFPAFSKLISGEFQGMLKESTQLLEQYKSELKNLEVGSQEYIDKQKAIADLTRNIMMAVAVQTVEAFQEMYNFMQQNSDAYYQRQFETLEMQKDVAIKFAGESVVAREEVERQYEERRRQIERERAKQKKETAIFNAIIDLSQGIMSTIGQLGFPAAIPMIALLTALGSVQIGMIASQPLPAFAEGGVHTQGGLMLVNDGKGSNYRETIVTPDGKVMKPQGRNVVMNAPKGTQIFTHDQWQKHISGIVMGEKLNYQKPIDRGITKEDLKDVFNSYYSGQKEITNVTIDKQGINATIIKGATKAKQLNNRIRIKSNG